MAIKLLICIQINYRCKTFLKGNVRMYCLKVAKPKPVNILPYYRTQGIWAQFALGPRIHRTINTLKRPQDSFTTGARPVLAHNIILNM